MKSIYGAVAQLLEAGQPFALATIVRTRGSTPQRAGAQAIFYPDGRTDGNLGGGCLEMEARRRALLCLDYGRPEFFDLHLNSDYGFDDGLICGGTAEVLIEPMLARSTDIFRAAADAIDQQRDAGMALIASGPGVGSRVLQVSGDSAIVEPGSGTLAALLEEWAATAASRRLEGPQRQDSGDAIFYIEPLLRDPSLLIVGCGHVGTALGRLASRLDFHLIMIDDRPSFADPDRLPWANRVMLGPTVETVRQIDLAPDSSVVIVTRGHRNDGAVLREMLDRPLAYLGMIGSRRKVKLIFDELLEEGRARPADLARVRAPIGLDIGAQSVEEITVSIAAELIMVRHREREPTGRPLCERRPRPSSADPASEGAPDR